MSVSMHKGYKPLFPWFGGKRKVSTEVWKRLGDPSTYIEPFFGTGAVMFMRPNEPNIEIINDKDCFVTNFWRAVKYAPREVAAHADMPVNQIELNAWFRHKIKSKDLLENLIADTRYYNAELAGKWAFGASLCIGNAWHRDNPQWLSICAAKTKGIMRTNQNAAELVNRFHSRLKNARILCSSWEYAVCKTNIESGGSVGIFLDPPYTESAGRDNNLYAEEDTSIGYQVAQWAFENGDNPKLRIALCGYEGEYSPPPLWETVEWKANVGYANNSSTGNNNRTKERIWFSPHCQKPERQLIMFS